MGMRSHFPQNGRNSYPGQPATSEFPTTRIGIFILHGGTVFAIFVVAAYCRALSLYCILQETCILRTVGVVYRTEGHNLEGFSQNLHLRARIFSAKAVCSPERGIGARGENSGLATGLVSLHPA